MTTQKMTLTALEDGIEVFVMDANGRDWIHRMDRHDQISFDRAQVFLPHDSDVVVVQDGEFDYTFDRSEYFTSLSFVECREVA